MLQSCDTMVALNGASKNGQTLFAKNSDRPAEECQPLVWHEREVHPKNATVKCQFLDIPQVETTYRHIGSRPYWCWGYEHGFNEHQVVIGNEALPAKLAPFSEPKLVGMEILRLGLERARSAAEAVETMTGLVSQYGQGKFENGAGVRTYDNGYIIADPQEAYVLETAGHHWAVKRVERTAGISNVYSVETDWHSLSADAEIEAIVQGWWPADRGRFNFAAAYSATDRSQGSGAMRRARSCAVLSHRAGTIEAQTMINLLSDHGGGQAAPDNFDPVINPGTGICVHSKFEGSSGNTAASLVADLCADGARLPVYWCSFYSPCLSLFFPLFIEGSLPAALSLGGEKPSDDSPWWRFHRLSRLAQANGGAGVSLVRTGWAEFQGHLFETAYQIAAEGRQLQQSGQLTQLATLLDGYTAGNVSKMLQMATDMIEQLEHETAVETAMV